MLVVERRPVCGGETAEDGAEAVSHVTAPSAYVRPVEKVVVATPVHVPLTLPSIWPFRAAKSEEVAMAVGAALPPVALASTVLAF